MLQRLFFEAVSCASFFDSARKSSRNLKIIDKDIYFKKQT